MAACVLVELTTTNPDKMCEDIDKLSDTRMADGLASPG